MKRRGSSVPDHLAGGILESRERRSEWGPKRDVVLPDSVLVLIQALNKHDAHHWKWVPGVIKAVLDIVCESEARYYWVPFEDRVQECVIKDQGGIKAIEDSYNHILLRCDCSWKRSCSSASLIGFVVSAQSPSLPMGNTDNNWWLKLTWVLRGHEISFNSSPDLSPLPSQTQLGPLRKRHTYTAVNHYTWRMPYPLRPEK